MRFELPGATAIALMIDPMDGLMFAHCGPVVEVFAALTSLLRHSDAPPASIVFALLGSRMNGAMKFALPVHASSIRYGATLLQLRLLLPPKISVEKFAPPV